MISLVMPTLNRARTLDRAIRSLLAQTWTDWELIIVDGASSDNSVEIIQRYAETDTRIRLIVEKSNVLAAKNIGFDHVRGEWIGIFDSDDELVPHALETLMQQLDRISPDLDAISCNCLDSSTGKWSGRGLRRSQWLTVPEVLLRGRGEHWGIFRRKILGNKRFNERVGGRESVLWDQIHENAKWYYLHEALRIYHTEGDDRLTDRGRLDAKYKQAYNQFRAIFDDEKPYLGKLQEWSPPAYRELVFKAGGQFVFAGDHARFEESYRYLRSSGAIVRPLCLSVGMRLSPILRKVVKVWSNWENADR